MYPSFFVCDPVCNTGRDATSGAKSNSLDVFLAVINIDMFIGCFHCGCRFGLSGVLSQSAVPVSRRPQSGLFSEFPYSKCTPSEGGTYRLAQTSQFLGDRTYCFTIRLQPCSGPCCNADLYKLEVRIICIERSRLLGLRGMSR